eukprot:12920108-Prorocentrum_lima.AAC.1
MPIVQYGRGLDPSATSPSFKHLQVPSVTVSGSVLFMSTKLGLVRKMQMFQPKRTDQLLQGVQCLTRFFVPNMDTRNG